MPRILNFYMDDSGTRAPNREPLPYNKNARDFFALGGVLIDEEAEAAARKLYGDFCARWSISYPLHSVEIRHRRERFLWLGRDRSERDKFMNDLSRTLLSLDILGLACVIDRPGYDAGPIALAGYEPENRAYVALRSSGRLIENRLSPSRVDAGGSKYSCFELVCRHRRGG